MKCAWQYFWNSDVLDFAIFVAKCVCEGKKQAEYNCFMLLYAILDSEYYKSQALRNAKEAYQIHQERVS